jgi:hypothetical protein
MKAEENSTITITFGDAGENHVGMQQLGTKAKTGFSFDDLKRVHDMFKEDYTTEFIELEQFLPENLRNDETKTACVLVVRDGIQCFELDHDEVFASLKKLAWDSKFWSQKHGRVVNKNARHNCCFADFSQVADLESKRGTVHDFKEVPYLDKIRSDMSMILGDRVKSFIAEGNYYYNSKQCGIGYHSDAERKMVIACRFGKEMPLCFHWYQENSRVGTKCSINIKGGDFYIMSEVAVGSKARKIPTLRHSAGCSKYTD